MPSVPSRVGFAAPINFTGTVKLSKLVSKSTMFLYFRQQKVFEWHRQVKRDVNLSIERLKGMIYRIAVTIYQ
ncbi:MAG: hypothetical protein RCO49_05710 [Rickettsia endosymbiont of Argas persicus]